DRKRPTSSRTRPSTRTYVE
ncbi:hypothetical protein AVDCRST_MAG84-1860, partial [uncultured Microcoleus sp.]